MKLSYWNITIGDQLRKLRISNDYSQAFVATCLGLSRNAYAAWENGLIDFSLSKLEAVCEFYGMSIIELISHLPPPAHTFMI